jgi:hypothetical protein
METLDILVLLTFLGLLALLVARKSSSENYDGNPVAKIDAEDDEEEDEETDAELQSASKSQAAEAGIGGTYIYHSTIFSLCVFIVKSMRDGDALQMVCAVIALLVLMFVHRKKTENYEFKSEPLGLYGGVPKHDDSNPTTDDDSWQTLYGRIRRTKRVRHDLIFDEDQDISEDD